MTLPTQTNIDIFTLEMRPIREARTSTLIAAYRKEPAFAGDITWEMAIAVTPLDKRPCQILWDEGTVRYHIAPFQRPDGSVEWLPYCQEGATYWGRSPLFLVGLGISNYSEEEIWDMIKDISLSDTGSPTAMYKDWVWQVLPVSVSYSLSQVQEVYFRTSAWPKLKSSMLATARRK